MFGMGHWEVLALLVIVLLLFGPKNLPRLAQALGKSVRELKNGMQGIGDEMKDAMDTKNDEPKKPETQTPTESEARPPHHSTQN